jgi:hypothetical protein
MKIKAEKCVPIGKGLGLYCGRARFEALAGILPNGSSPSRVNNLHIVQIHLRPTQLPIQRVQRSLPR